MATWKVETLLEDLKPGISWRKVWLKWEGSCWVTLSHKTFRTSSFDVLWNNRGRLHTALQFQFFIFVVSFLRFSAKDFGKLVESKSKVKACKHSLSFLSICRGQERNYLVDGDTSVGLRNSSGFSTSRASLMGVFSLAVGLKQHSSLKEACINESLGHLNFY